MQIRSRIVARGFKSDDRPDLPEALGGQHGRRRWENWAVEKKEYVWKTGRSKLLGASLARAFPKQGYQLGLSSKNLFRHEEHRVPGPLFHILEVLGVELATPTLVTWVQIFSRRLSQWQHRQLLQPPNLLTVPPTVLAGCAHHIAVAHVQTLPFSVGTTASQVGATAWFASTVLWIWLGTLAMRCTCVTV